MQVSIDITALRANFKRLASQCYRGKISPVVKANCYGLGMGKIVPALLKEGCETFFVAHIQEGAALRKLAPKAKIYCLNGPQTKKHITIIHQAKLSPVLNSLAQIALWAGNDADPLVQPAIHIDTGMNRLGVSIEQFEELCKSGKLQKLNVSLVMSHLASADEIVSSQNAVQLKRFQKIAALKESYFKEANLSLANSAGVFLGKEYHYELVRPGIALYGGEPIDGTSQGIKPVLHIKAPIIQVRELQKGDKVSYGGTFQAKTPMRVATIGIGYADGFKRHLSAKGFVAIEAVLCPIIGRVTMDLIMVDISALPEGQGKAGDMAEILGETITADKMARWAGTISYEILTGFSQVRA